MNEFVALSNGMHDVGHRIEEVEKQNRKLERTHCRGCRMNCPFTKPSSHMVR
jgi:hypothetical protein